VAAVRALTKDREREVREAAANALKPGRISQPVLALSTPAW
jgi:hypothetical protein